MDGCTLPCSSAELHTCLRALICEVIKKQFDLSPEQLAPSAKGGAPRDPLELSTAKAKGADLCLHCWAFSRPLKTKPAEAAATLSKAINDELESNPAAALLVRETSADKAGHVNFVLKTDVLASVTMAPYFGKGVSAASPAVDSGEKKQRVLIEFSSPNTNKPQHLGHVRNNVLGDCISRLLSHAGDKEVVKVNLINDRGVHICKSMWAYSQHGGGETPGSSGIKGDHLVGKYYVEFERHFQGEYKTWLAAEDGGKAAFERWSAGAGKTALARAKKTNDKSEAAIVREEKALAKAKTESEAAQAAFDRLEAQLAEMEDGDEGKPALKKKHHNAHLKVVKTASKCESSEAAIEKARKRIITEWDLFRGEYKDTFFNNDSTIGGATREMLRKWEAGDEEVHALWELMNEWVFEGFAETYKTFGIEFDIIQKESQTYVLGKDMVHEGVKQGKLDRACDLDGANPEDKAVYCDLGKTGMKKAGRNKKYLLRADGTSIYMTQDLGTAAKRFEELGADRLIYVVADEQITHFQELFSILYYLLPQHKDSAYHLSYGMVNLPHGRMKSREGTVVDADNLVDELTAMAKEKAREKWEKKGEVPDESVLNDRARKIALAAIRFYLLQVHPSRSVVFDPEQSLDFEGKTGPYMLYSYARTRSILRKAGVEDIDNMLFDPSVLKHLDTREERTVLAKLLEVPNSYGPAASDKDPSRVAESAYFLAKAYSVICQKKATHAIISCDDPPTRKARLLLTYAVGAALKEALGLLGIQTIEQM